MDLDSVDADEELLGHLPVRDPGGDQSQHLSLTIGERFPSFGHS
jgi:hypothetical protein